LVKPCCFGYSVVFWGWGVFFGVHGFGVFPSVSACCVRIV
jgi:hypothetical protein